MQKVPEDQERDLQVWVWPIYQDLANKAEGRKVNIKAMEDMLIFV